jgi:hypothetical protein
MRAEKDIADEVATLEECLTSIRNRTDTALLLLNLNREDLIYTTLEDIGYSAQTMIERYCVRND